MFLKNLVLGVFIMSAPAFASTYHKYDFNTANDITADDMQDLSYDVQYFYETLRECTSATQVKFFRANRLENLVYWDSRNGVRGFNVKASGHLPMPSGQPFTVELEITKTPIRDQNPPADGRQRTKTVCKINVTP